MTQPNDFATRLESLTASIDVEGDPIHRFALIQMRDALLANHAPALVRLVRAAEQLRDADSRLQDVSGAHEVIAALAALNAEDKT